MSDIDQLLQKVDQVYPAPAGAPVINDALAKVDAAFPPPQEEDTLLENTLDVGGELAAAGNRSFGQFLDTLVRAGHISSGGYKGLATLLTGATLDEAVKATQVGESPSIVESLEATGIQGGFMEPGTAREVVRAGGEVLIPGGAALKTVQGRNVAQKSLDQLAELIGAGQAAAVAPVKAALPALTDAASAVSPGAAKARKVAELPLKRRTGDVVTAKYMLDDAGKVIEDKVAKRAIASGMDEGSVAMLKESPRAAKNRMLEMLDRIERGIENKRFKINSRPLDVTGKSIVERAKVLKAENRNAANNLDRIAKTLKGKRVDVAPAVDNFLNALDSEGIGFRKGKLDFGNSSIEGLKKPQFIIRNVVKRMHKTRVPDAYDVHRLKKFIDENVTYGKSQSGLSGKMEGVIKSLRRELDGILDSNFKSYDKVNSTYAETREVLDKLQDLAGRKVNIYGQNGDSAIGTLSRRLLSNAQSRIPLKDMLGELDNVAQKYGYAANDDIIAQVAFVDEMERLFEIGSETSLQGDVRKAISSMTDSRGPILRGIEAIADKVTTPHYSERIQAIRTLLEN